MDQNPVLIPNQNSLTVFLMKLKSATQVLKCLSVLLLVHFKVKFLEPLNVLLLMCVYV